MVNQDFCDKSDKNNIISYKKGMQGQFLEEKVINTNVKVAKVFIIGVTEGDGFNNRWVPRKCIDVGQPWKTDLNEWKIVEESEVPEDKTVFIRTDVNIKNGATGIVVPLASFRLAKPKTVPASGELCVFSKDELDEGHALFHHEPFTDGMQGPVAGTSYYLVIEVRKDATPHPHSWSRLPEIGPFENWDQARSWAVRVEWEHPKGSGKWRFTYLHAGNESGEGLFDLVNENIPGSLKVYAQSIEFLQWLCNAEPAHEHSWVGRYSGTAHVLQTTYDMMAQSIHFKVPTDQIQMVSSVRKHDDDIKTELRDPKHGLENVDGEFGLVVGEDSSVSQRMTCDLCTTAPNDIEALEYGGCIRMGNSRVCTNCHRLGRPCCSWTTGAKEMPRDKSRLSLEQVNKANAICSVVFMQLSPDIPETLQNFEMQLRMLPSSERTEGDGELVEDGEDEVDEGDKVV
jgi:hypothetical protein